MLVIPEELFITEVTETRSHLVLLTLGLWNQYYQYVWNQYYQYVFFDIIREGRGLQVTSSASDVAAEQ